jgi:DNA-binding NarL/FixJ family response regulator
MIDNHDKLRILVADDHELMRRGISGLLHSQHSWKVVAEAANGLEAVAKARKLRPDVAIVDIEMPELDGLEAIRQIRKAVPSTKILTLTMHDSGRIVRRALEAGARGFVRKSDLPRELINAVRDVTNGRPYFAPGVAEIILDGIRNGETESTLRPQDQPTSRELQIIRLLAEGKGNKEIAIALEISVRTAETHRARIMLKLGCHSLVDLLHYAIRNEIVSTRDL